MKQSVVVVLQTVIDETICDYCFIMIIASQSIG